MDQTEEVVSAMAAEALRSVMSGVGEAPGRQWFADLAEAVVDAGRCVRCGACVGACPSGSLALGARGLPELVKMCTGCGRCVDLCPRAGLGYESTWVDGPDETGLGLGAVLGAWSARSSRRVPGVQDGGVVTEVLVAGLERGELDGVVVAKPVPGQPGRAVAALAERAEDVREAAGSFYGWTGGLAALFEVPDVDPDARLALVGTPCQLQGLSALRRWPLGGRARRFAQVVLGIALWCSKSFDTDSLFVGELEQRRGIDLRQVAKVDISGGRISVIGEDGEVLLCERVSGVAKAGFAGCAECADFSGRSADLAVGSIGSPEGYSSVLVRSAAGAKALDWAADTLERRPLVDPGAVAQADQREARRAAARLGRPLDPSAPVLLRERRGPLDAGARGGFGA
jgi:coenzyme F420 hydrogenase subunit beta